MSTLHGRDIDRERDLSNYRQSRDYDRDQDRDQDREISLGTGTILGIFFALALLCALFFGFGYSMGRKSAQPTASTADAAPTTLLGGPKPSPGSPIASASKSADTALNAAPTTASDTNSSSQPPQASSTPEEPASGPKPVLAKSPADATSEDTPIPGVIKTVAKTISTPPAPPVRASVGDSAMPQINPNGTVMVQVAAVSHQEDADLLVSALKNRGYTVFIRQEPQDHLLHVQVGPFANKKDADAMRQHLLADGYNAIVK